MVICFAKKIFLVRQHASCLIKIFQLTSWFGKFKTQIKYKSHQGKGSHASLNPTTSEPEGLKYVNTENVSIRKLDHLINFREKYLMIKIDVQQHFERRCPKC